MLNRLQITPELTTACLGHVSSRTWDFSATQPVRARLPSDQRAGKRASPQMRPPPLGPRRQWTGRPCAGHDRQATNRPTSTQQASHRAGQPPPIVGDAMPGDLPASLLRQFAAVVGPAHVLTGDAAAGYAVDWTGGFTGHAPAVLRPRDTAEAAALLALCADAGVA